MLVLFEAERIAATPYLQLPTTPQTYLRKIEKGTLLYLFEMGGGLRFRALAVAVAGIFLVPLARGSALNGLGCMLNIVAHELAHPTISTITLYGAKRKTLVAPVPAAALSAA